VIQELCTTDHLAIRRWAEQREAAPISRLGFDFPDYDDELDPIPWDRWFAEFDEQDLEFVYLDDRSGPASNFFALRPRRHHDSPNMSL
jgi:hypothetical protein